MIVRKYESEELISQLYNEFKKKYKHKYSRTAWEYIEENFWTFVFSNTAPDILMQIYHEIGIEAESGNFYQEHLKRIDSLFGLDKNILDVGSGMIPAFAEKVAHEQLRIGKGTITIYEPELLLKKPKYPNMTLHKKEFTSNTRIKEFDLVTGIMPCDATESIIESACQNGKDFYVAMCGCTHFDYIPWYMVVTPESYQEYVIGQTLRMLEHYDNGTLVVEKLSDNYAIDYPILYNRKK